MPAKYATRDRAWGSRYDTLKLSSPPLSPSAQRNDPTTASSTPHSPSSRHAQDAAHGGSISTPTKPETTSQDASIFIGSLPTATDYLDIHRQLTEHLREHQEIKSVKVVRDSKGGTCAFAQCEDMETAIRLLEKLQDIAHRRPFLGRYLRFELARAFRALFISYRAPQPTAYPNSAMDAPSNGDSPSQGSVLHHAMRIYKPPSGKHYAVIFDAEALDFESKLTSQTNASEPSNPTDPLNGAGLLLSPLRFDAESLCKIVTAFGKVVNFGPLVTDGEGPEGRPDLNPHSGPRATGMDEHIWEIKWAHRDDCINAQMTLRNVPHFSVTWAHRSYPDTGAGLESRFGSPTVTSSPRFPPGSRSRTQSRSYYPTGGELQRFAPAGLNSSMTDLRITGSPSYAQSSLSPQSVPFVPSLAPLSLRTPSSPLVSRSALDTEGQEMTVIADLSDADFPPLHQRELAQRPKRGARPPDLSWAFQDIPEVASDPFASSSALSTSPSSSLSMQPSTPTPLDVLMSPGSDNDVSPRYRRHSTSEGQAYLNQFQGQEITMPPTPAFTAASITPVTPKTGPSFPHTPQSERGTFASIEPYVNGSLRMFSKPGGRLPERHDGRANEIDPLCIFVGGLDVVGPNPWTEDRVREVFSKYGEIEKLEFNCRQGSRWAYAFVQYPSTAASASAVAAENIRMYDGRTIRVRLREMYPSRNTQRFPRPRPRQPYESGSFRRPFESATQLNDDFRVQPHPQLQEALQRPLQTNLSQSSTLTACEDVPQPTFPSIATSELGLPSSSGASSPAKKAVSQEEVAQDRPISATSGSVSSPPSSTGQSAAMGPLQPYSVVPPQSWIQPFAPYAYPIPYTGYMTYPPPGAYRPNPVFGDPASGAPYLWPGLAYRPTPPSQPATYQQAAPSAGETGQAQSQPPLRPTGFIEGEQGTLIAVYPPDALNQYMSTSGQTASQTPPPPGAPATQPQAAPPVSGWTPYMAGPPPMPVYPYPYPHPAIPLGPPHTQQSLVAPGQYPMNAWPSTAPVPYMVTPHGLPPSHSQAGAFSQPPPSGHSASSAALMPSSSFNRGPNTGYSLPAPASQHDFGVASRGSPHAGPRRFVKNPGPAGQSGTNMPPGQGQFFRGVLRNDSFHASCSPPHLNRRDSSGMDASYGDASGSIQVHPHVGPPAQHMSMRASGSYASALAPTGHTAY